MASSKLNLVSLCEEDVQNNKNFIDQNIFKIRENTEMEPPLLFESLTEDEKMSISLPLPLPSPTPEEDLEEMVVKRNGRKEPVDPSKISRRLQRLKSSVEKILGRKLQISVWRIAKNTIKQIYDGITTSELDEEAAEVSAFITDHPDYADFAGHILVSNLEANNRHCMGFLACMQKAHNFVEERADKNVPLVSDELLAIAKKYGHLIDREMCMERNYLYNYFAMQTLIKGQYLRCAYKTVQKNRKKIVEMVPFETPQHMWMRVALGIHGWDKDAAFEHYHVMSQKFGTMATPTLFNAGTPRPQLSSCFLLSVKDDSIAGIYDTLKECALISKEAGGIGLNVHNIRGAGSYISGTNGTSNGLLPMLRVFNNTARYVDQGGQKRKGSFAIYLEPWHPDLLTFLDLKKQNGVEEERARDLFYAIWMCDEFMRRVEKAFSVEARETGEEVMWSFMDPNECRGLYDCHGEAFDQLYRGYEAQGKFVKQIPVDKVIYAILSAQLETGTPYILYKDACNHKSNQKNLGTIRSSNLCSEIVEYSSSEETAVCNLASLALSMFVDEKTRTFNFDKLQEVTAIMIRALNKVIDRNYYPVQTAHRSNMRHRPVGLGVQGLADAFIKMRLPYGCPEAIQLNRDISETMYFAAVTTSHQLACEVDPSTDQPYGPYPSIDDHGGAPLRQGIFHFELCRDDFKESKDPEGWRPNPKLGYDWEDLRVKVMRDGTRNSLLLANMPTASTSQILGNQESIEPFYGAMFVRRTKAGEFYQYCTPLIRELSDLGLWRTEYHPVTGKIYIPLKEKIKANRGSLQGITEIPEDLRQLYLTIGDIPLQTQVTMARDRGLFIDQSQSFNVHFRNKDNMMPSMLKYMIFSWKLGLKTGSYYVRTLQDLDVLNFTGTNVVRQEDECVSCSG